LEDRVHDTFLIVIQAIRRGDLREPERLMGFIRTVVRRQISSYIEQAVSRRREQGEMDSTFSMVDRESSPEQRAIDQQKRELMAGILNRLGSRDREILTRFYLHEQTQEQICEEMALTETQFRLLKSRAKAKFGEIGKKTHAPVHGDFLEKFRERRPLTCQNISRRHRAECRRRRRMLMTFDQKPHPGNEVLEEYSLQRLSAAECDRVEDHLLLCEQCQEELIRIETFIRDMKVVCGVPQTKVAPSTESLLGRWLTLIPRPAMVAAFAAVVLAVGIPMMRDSETAALAPLAVQLTVMRGRESTTMATAEKQRPLQLRISAAELP
jgi:RNA polymerase sigma factor (sigma-70 family)